MADIARIKGNIAKMIDQNAPEADIDAYVGSEGITLEQLRASPKETTGSTGTANAFLGSTIEGVPIVGPLIRAGADRAGAGIRSLVYGTPYADELKAVQDYTAQAAKENPTVSTVGNIAGSVAGTIPMVMAAPAAFGAGGGGLIARSLASGATGAAIGGADSAVRSGGDIDATVNGAVTGGAFGLAAPAASQLVTRAATRAMSPFRASPERMDAANALAREGVETTAGQRTGSRGLRYAEGELGGRTVDDLMERQGEQFTAAALRRAGVNANRATPDVIDNAFTRIGQEFDGLAARNRITPDQQMLNDLQAAVTNYGQLVPEAMRAPIVRNVAEDILGAMRRGPISGESYQALRSRLERAARGAARDPELAHALRGLRETLDEAMERSLAGTADAGAWREARNQYRNLLTIEKAATGAGENAALGLISPSQLRNATVQQGRRAYARGQGDFAELARAGEALLKPLPQSGTAPRLRAQNLGLSLLPTIAGAGAGGAYGASEGGPSGAIFGALAGAAIPRAAGAAMMSRPGQAFLSNQAGPAAAPQIEALLRAILASSPPVANQARLGQ